MSRIAWCSVAATKALFVLALVPLANPAEPLRGMGERESASTNGDIHQNLAKKTRNGRIVARMGRLPEALIGLTIW